MPRYEFVLLLESAETSRLAADNNIEGCRQRPVGIHIGLDLADVRWRGFFAGSLRVPLLDDDAVALEDPLHGFFPGPDANHPQRNARLLHRLGRVIHFIHQSQPEMIMPAVI